MKFWTFCLIWTCMTIQPVLALDAGLQYIKNRGNIICGTELSSKALAHKDENGIWRGMDADLCRIFSIAIFGKDNRFRLVDVKAQNVNSAIRHNKIDVMLGNAPATASNEISGNTTQSALLYYVKQMFLAHKIDNASSMEDFKGKKVCVISNSDSWNNLQRYNEKYQLQLKPLFFKSPLEAKQAFLLRRCDLYSDNELYLLSLLEETKKNLNTVELLPEVIAEKPIYAQVLKENQQLRITIKWILNALKLAEKEGLNSKNSEIFINQKDETIRNLLGVNPDLWQKFQLNPTWLQTVLTQFGNYGEIYENNLGQNSEFKLERGKNELVEKGGLISSETFF